MSICSICGKMESATKGLIRDGEFICSKHLLKCADCGTLFFEDDEHIEADGDVICENCMENYSYCDYCGEYYHNDDMVRVNTSHGEDWLCSSCADVKVFYCDNCGEYYLTRDYAYYDRRGTSDVICENCITDGDFCVCADCGEVDRWDDMQEGDDGDYYCYDCIDNHREESTIHEYGWTPDNDGDGYNFYKNNDEEKPRYYIGYELEAEGDESEASAYLEHFKNGEDIIFLTHDSSIENGGFEITSHPMSFDYMYNSPFTTELKNSFEFLDKKGFKSHNRGGLHVHVSSDDISSTQLGVMACILYNYRNSDNYKKILGITQRKAKKIEHWASVTMPDNYTKEDFFNRVVYTNRVSHDRYNGLNVTSRTVEFRIFNGNLRFERFLKNIEFVQAVLDYSEIIADEIKTLNADGFPLDAYLNKYADINALINYINETAGKYANLKAFLIEKGIKADEIMADAILTDTQNNA